MRRALSNEALLQVVSGSHILGLEIGLWENDPDYSNLSLEVFGELQEESWRQ